jgi:hypothetical protein
VQARNDIAFTRLCSLIEAAEGILHPDAVRYSGERVVYRHLLDLGALVPGDGVSAGILCPWCSGTELADIRFAQEQHQGYCIDCGWVDLDADQVKPLRVDVARIVRRLSAALGLAGRYACDALVPDALWRLGEIEHRRRRRTVFFGRRLVDPTLVPLITQQLHNACAPGCGVLITTTPDVDAALLATGHQVVPLRAVAHLRKAGFVIENLEAYLDGTDLHDEPSSETSLRLLHSGRMALINGQQYKLSPQVYDFLRVLEEAGGEPVHKRAIADALGIDVDKCKGVDICKRHKAVYRTFVAHDAAGNYWLKPVQYKTYIYGFNKQR